MNSRFFSLRYVVTLILIMISVGLIYWSWKTYDQEIEVPINGTRQINSTKHLNEIKELSAILNKPRGARSGHDVIADKNLFSQEREEWVNPVTEQQAEHPSKVKRTDVVLYGIYRSGGESIAILGLPRIAENNKKFLLTAGDKADSQPGRPPFSYTLVSIEEEGVTVRDHNGAVFSVGLYDHQRSPSLPRAAIPPGGSGVKVVTTKPSPNANKGGGVVRPDSGKTPNGITKPVNAMSKAEKEAMVKQGKLKKVSTPFGTLYRPIKK